MDSHALVSRFKHLKKKCLFHMFVSCPSNKVLVRWGKYTAKIAAWSKQTDKRCQAGQVM